MTPGYGHGARGATYDGLRITRHEKGTVMEPQYQAWIDQDDAETIAIIRRFGWKVQYIGGDECACPTCEGAASEGPPFAYTVGLFGLGHPELLIFAVEPSTAAGLLNTLGRRIRSGETLLPGGLLKFVEWQHRVIPETVPNPGDILFGANRFYQRPDHESVPALQLSYDDSEGRFPWEKGYSEPDLQPRPGTFRA